MNKSFWCALATMVMLALAGCMHPAPGEKGHRQTYWPLMQHLHHTNPEALQGFKELKKTDLQAYQKRLAELNATFGPAVVRAKGADGNFTCHCAACLNAEKSTAKAPAQ